MSAPTEKGAEEFGFCVGRVIGAARSGSISDHDRATLLAALRPTPPEELRAEVRAILSEFERAVNDDSLTADDDAEAAILALLQPTESGGQVFPGWINSGDAGMLESGQGYVVHFDPMDGECLPPNDGEPVRVYLCDFDPRAMAGRPTEREGEPARGTLVCTECATEEAVEAVCNDCGQSARWLARPEEKGE